jgi:hypothetical protein
MNFITIILDPTRLYTDYGVVDLTKGILVCRTPSFHEAERIAEALNEHGLKQLQPTKALIENQP